MYQIHKVINDVSAFVEKIWGVIPAFCKGCIIVLSIIAGINIIYSLVKAITDNKDKWKPLQNSMLMYSFSAGSGNFQRHAIYIDSHKYLLDKKWSIISFAGIAYRVGNIETESRFITFILSVFYLPLALLGMVEMVIRFFVGVSFYFCCNIVYLVLLGVLWIENMALMPLMNLLDRSSWEKQHCPNDYTAFRLPVFECPHCGRKHDKLFPGRSGLFWAKCQCGHFLPCSSFTGRKRLPSFCPKCGYSLVAANAEILSIQVVGGNSSGKTAFISAFQHEYLRSLTPTTRKETLVGPVKSFEELEEMFQQGETRKSSTDQVHSYSIIHKTTGAADIGMTIYDVPDEVILNEQYDKNPLNFAYCDGIALIIDPLSVQSVWNECLTICGSQSIKGYSNDSAEDIIIHFINKFSEVAGRSARKMSNTPVSVIITKTDLTPIKQRIGKTKIKAERHKYSSYAEARDTMCRNYLLTIGLGNVLNNLESVFSNISYYPISAIGGTVEQVKSFEPQGVIQPIYWIAQQNKSAIEPYFQEVKEAAK